MIYITILALGLALFILLRTLSWFFMALISLQKIRLIFHRIFPAVEMILWVSYILWAADKLFQETAVYPILTGSLIISLVAITGWYLLRDFISGIILKAENGFEPGQKISTSAYTGTIKKPGYRSLEIVSSEGALVKVPYTQLSKTDISKPSNNSKWVDHVITLNIPAVKSPAEIKIALLKRLLEMPWIVSGETIQIEIGRVQEDLYEAEISFQSVGLEMAAKTEEILRVLIKEKLSNL